MIGASPGASSRIEENRLKALNYLRPENKELETDRHVIPIRSKTAYYEQFSSDWLQEC